MENAYTPRGLPISKDTDYPLGAWSHHGLLWQEFLKICAQLLHGPPHVPVPDFTGLTVQLYMIAWVLCHLDPRFTSRNWNTHLFFLGDPGHFVGNITQPGDVWDGTSSKHCLWWSSRMQRTLVTFITVVNGRTEQTILPSADSFDVLTSTVMR